MVKNLDFWFIVCLASLGVAFGLLTVFGLISGLEHQLAMIFLVGVGVTVALRKKTKVAQHSFIAGFAAGVAALWCQALFFSTYAQNNPGYADVALPWGLTPVTFTFLLSPVGGLVCGIICFAVAVPIAYFLRRKAP